MCSYHLLLFRNFRLTNANLLFRLSYYHAHRSYRLCPLRLNCVLQTGKPQNSIMASVGAVQYRVSSFLHERLPQTIVPRTYHYRHSGVVQQLELNLHSCLAPFHSAAGQTDACRSSVYEMDETGTRQTRDGDMDDKTTVLSFQTVTETLTVYE